MRPDHTDYGSDSDSASYTPALHRPPSHRGPRQQSRRSFSHNRSRRRSREKAENSHFGAKGEGQNIAGAPDFRFTLPGAQATVDPAPNDRSNTPVKSDSKSSHTGAGYTESSALQAARRTLDKVIKKKGAAEKAKDFAVVSDLQHSPSPIRK